MNGFASFLRRRKSVLNYLAFGVITTAINILAYHLLYYECRFSNVYSNIVSWVIAKIIIAFFTNKYFVFESKTSSAKNVLEEFFSFMGWRVASGLLDLGIMYVAVDCLNQDGLFWKVTSNILVIILNYITGKLLVFRKKA